MANTPTYQTNAVDRLAPQTPQTPTRSLSSTIGDLNTNLTTAFAPTQQTIMQAYQSARGQTQQATENINKATTDRYQQDINFQNQINTNQGISQLEGQRGFAINPGAIVAFQQQADKRVKDLRNQMNDALLQNNASGAKALADLMVNEQTAITSARTSFLNQYFGTAQEARAQQSFQTPEQKSVMDLSNAHPDAGILPSDTLATATAKVQQAPSFSQNIELGRANISKALAEAQLTQANIGLTGAQAQLAQGQIGLLPAQRQLYEAQAVAAPITARAALTGAGAQVTAANAQAGLAGAQTRLLNTFGNGTITPDNGDVQGLLNGSQTIDTLHQKYDGLPNGAGSAIIANIVSVAQSQGFDPQQSFLNNTKAQANARSLGGGGIGGALTAGTNLLGSFFTGNGSTPSLSRKIPTGTDGAFYGFPGYHSDGTKWVKNK